MKDSVISQVKKEDGHRMRAAWFSLFVGIVLLALKLVGFRLTNSQAVLSDALESIVNVITAAGAIWVLMIASKPADKEHPYGHGKIEFFSATFEGGLIAVAALMIFINAIEAIFVGVELKELNAGLVIVFSAGIVNALLGI